MKAVHIYISILAFLSTNAFCQSERKVIIHQLPMQVPENKVWEIIPNKETQVQFSALKRYSICAEPLKYYPSTICCLNKVVGTGDVSIQIHISYFEKITNTTNRSYNITPSGEKIIFKAGEKVYTASCIEAITLTELDASTEVQLMADAQQEEQSKEAEAERQKQALLLSNTIFDCNGHEKENMEACSALIDPEQVREISTGIFTTYLETNPTDKEMVIDHYIKFIVDANGKVKHLDASVHASPGDSVIIMKLDNENLNRFKALNFTPAFYKGGYAVNSIYEMHVSMHVKRCTSLVKAKHSEVYFGEAVQQGESGGSKNQYKLVKLDSTSSMYQQIVQQKNFNMTKQQKHTMVYLSGECMVGLKTEAPEDKELMEEHVSAFLQLE